MFGLTPQQRQAAADHVNAITEIGIDSEPMARDHQMLLVLGHRSLTHGGEATQALYSLAVSMDIVDGHAGILH